MAERKVLKNQFHNGVILETWTQKYGLSINPCPDIDKVRISIIAKGSNGQDHNDHYIDAEEFRLLCNDIEDGTALIYFKSDTASDFPSAYQYSSGKQKNDGAMTITSKCAFGAGKKGPAVQVNNLKSNGKWSNKLVGISMGNLKSMAFYYKLIMGLIPVTPGSYYEILYKAFWEGNTKRQKYHSSSGSSDSTGSASGWPYTEDWQNNTPFVS